MAHGVELVNGLQDFVDRLGHPPLFRRRQAELFEERENLRVPLEGEPVGGARSIEDHAERALRDDFRIELLERAGCGIARVGEDGQTGRGPLLVQLREAALVHVNFPSHLQESRRRPAQTRRDRANGFDILGDVIADHAVPARGGMLQLALLVGQRDGHAIDFRLDHDRDFLVREQSSDPCIKARYFFFRVRIVQTQHRNPMPNLRKSLEGSAADPLGGRIGRGQLRETLFQIGQLLVEPVVLAVAHDRCSFLVVKPVMLCNLLPQLRHSLCGLRLVPSHDAMISSS